jgi:hypothetical protein
VIRAKFAALKKVDRKANCAWLRRMADGFDDDSYVHSIDHMGMKLRCLQQLYLTPFGTPGGLDEGFMVSADFADDADAK